MNCMHHRTKVSVKDTLCATEMKKVYNVDFLKEIFFIAYKSEAVKSEFIVL